MEGVPEDKLLYSFHRFLSCPILGIGKTFEETSIRYTAFVCFFFSFFLFQLFPSTFSLPHTKKYLTDKSFTKSQRNKAFGPCSGLRHLLGVLGTSGFIRALLQRVRALPPEPNWVSWE